MIIKVKTFRSKIDSYWYVVVLNNGTYNVSDGGEVMGNYKKYVLLHFTKARFTKFCSFCTCERRDEHGTEAQSYG